MPGVVIEWAAGAHSGTAGVTANRWTRYRIGCAGWSIPAAQAAAFAGGGTHLERYARVLGAVEIDSSFHRPHRRSTYERWAAAVPPAFRFAVKIPREITHVRRLAGVGDPLGRFLGEVEGLGEKLAVLLLQLPPSLEFEVRRARRFFRLLRAGYRGPVACEPRHPGWFSPAAERLLLDEGVCRVAADPPPVPEADRPAGWPGLIYFRLHGAPRRYYSSYSHESLEALAARLRESGSAPVWVIFDNTAAGAAIDNALALSRLVGLF